MCIFSDGDPDFDPLEVSGTMIFARGDGARQQLVYSMHLATTRELAMILPLPVPASSSEDAVRFIDLAGYRMLLHDIEACFRPESEDDIDDLFTDDDPSPRLQVHSVGAFEASFVPRLADFVRLDRRFRLSDAVWRQLPGYEDWGFAVIQMKEGKQQVHPIALTFPRRWQDHLFFPTVHVHDGKFHDEAFFDHMLYYQGMPAPTRSGAASERSVRSPALYAPTRHIDLARAQGVVDPELALERLRLHGMRPNEDVWLSPGRA